MLKEKGKVFNNEENFDVGFTFKYGYFCVCCSCQSFYGCPGRALVLYCDRATGGSRDY